VPADKRKAKSNQFSFVEQVPKKEQAANKKYL